MNTRKHLITLFIAASLTASSSRAMHLYQQERVVEKQKEEATKQLITLISNIYPTNTQEKDNLITKIKELLLKGANPDGYKDSHRPLVWAARNSRYADPVRILLEYGANPNVQDNSGTTALIGAACGGHVDTARILFEHCVDPDIQDYRGNTALIFATHFHNKNIVRLLLTYHTHWADPDIKDNHGDTALIVASREEKPIIEIIRLLLEKKGHANPNIQDKDGNSPLLLATHNENIISLLFEHGAKPNLKNKAGNTALINFVKSSHNIPSMPVELLLKNEANPNIKNNDGATALHYAARYGHAPIAKLLLEYGAAPVMADNHGVTALLLAAQHGQREIASELIKHAITKKIDGLKALREVKNCYLSLLPSDLIVFTVKLQAADFINGANDVGNTPLHAAAQNGHAEIVRLLLENSADKAFLNNEGKTALALAQENKNQNIIDLLHDKSAENQNEQK